MMSRFAYCLFFCAFLSCDEKPLEERADVPVEFIKIEIDHLMKGIGGVVIESTSPVALFFKEVHEYEENERKERRARARELGFTGFNTPAGPYIIRCDVQLDDGSSHEVAVLAYEDRTIAEHFLRLDHAAEFQKWFKDVEVKSKRSDADQ
jgi:hypothetical protein